MSLLFLAHHAGWVLSGLLELSGIGAFDVVYVGKWLFAHVAVEKEDCAQGIAWPTPR